MKKLIAVLALGATLPVMASGPYVGGQLGFASSTLKVDSVSFDDTAFLGGVFAGYEFSSNKAFFAIEGDFNFGDAKTNISGLELKRSHIYGISGLIGMPVTPEFDLYGRAGWARAKFKGAIGGLKDDSSENGYNLGAGGRYHLNDQVAVRLEYRYNKYNVDDPLDVYDHVFTAGLLYMF